MLRSIASLAARHWREYWLREALCLLAVAAVTALLYAGNLSDLGPEYQYLYHAIEIGV